jgi:hypothetical protein
MVRMLAMDTWTGCGLLFGLSVVTAALIIPLERRRRRRLSRQHVASHRELSDDEFLDQAGAPAGRRAVALGVRQAVAEAMGVPPATVHPSDSLEYALRCGFIGPDVYDLVFRLEKELRVNKIPKGILDQLVTAKGGFKACTVGDLVRYIAAQWESLLPAPRPRA